MLSNVASKKEPVPVSWQDYPGRAYPWGVGCMLSTHDVRVDRWYRTKKAAVAEGRKLLYRNPVLVRWHADGEPLRST
jgi:hypothetical protein